MSLLDSLKKLFRPSATESATDRNTTQGGQTLAVGHEPTIGSPLQPRARRVLCSGPHGLHNMAYTEWGDPSNPRVLVCVHGLTRNGRDFDDLARAPVRTTTTPPACCALRVPPVRCCWLATSAPQPRRS